MFRTEPQQTAVVLAPQGRRTSVLLLLPFLTALAAPASASTMDSLFDRSFGNLFAEDSSPRPRSRALPGSDSAEREEEGRRLRRMAWQAEKARLLESATPRLSERGPAPR